MLRREILLGVSHREASDNNSSLLQEIVKGVMSKGGLFCRRPKFVYRGHPENIAFFQNLAAKYFDLLESWGISGDFTTFLDNFSEHLGRFGDSKVHNNLLLLLGIDEGRMTDLVGKNYLCGLLTIAQDKDYFGLQGGKSKFVNDLIQFWNPLRGDSGKERMRGWLNEINNSGLLSLDVPPPFQPREIAGILGGSRENPFSPPGDSVPKAA